MADELHTHRFIETGGDLFGLWSHGDTPTIFLATRPGARAVRERLAFQQDVGSHRAMERLLWASAGCQCVGMWHSHHSIGLDVLSRGDLARTMRYARRSRRDRFVDLLGFFAEEWSVRPFLYEDPAMGRTRASRIEVIAGMSPVRAMLAGSAEAQRPALRDAPIGPPVHLSCVTSEAQSPSLAPAEGDGDPEPLPVSAPQGAGRGPWRAIDAVERVVSRVVPEALRQDMQLDVLDDGSLALRLTRGETRTLVALFCSGDRLRLDAWEVVGHRPVRGQPVGDDVVSDLQRALAALEFG